MNFRETGFEDVYWIHVAQNRVTGFCDLGDEHVGCIRTGNLMTS